MWMEFLSVNSLGVPKHHILVLLGGDWNHGILNDFPYIFHILGMSSLLGME